MELSTSLTAVLTVLAVLGLGYYGTDYVLDDQGLSEEDLENANDSNTPGVNQETGDGDTLGEEREIKGRDSNSANETNDTDEREVSQHGIIMTSEVVAGENARVLVYNEGKRLTGETVYLDGEEIGETSQTGALTFEVPNKEEIEVSTDSRASEELYLVDNYQPVNFNLASPENNTVFDDYRADVTAGITSEKDITYDIILDEETIYSSESSSGKTSVYQDTIYVDSAGSHKLWIKAEDKDGNQFNSNVLNFETAQDKSENNIEIISPDSKSLDSYKTDISFSVSSARDYNYTVSIDGQEYVSYSDVPAGSQTKKVEWRDLNPKGNHSYKIKLESADGEILKERQSWFNLEQEPPIGEFRFEDMGGIGNNTETSGYVSLAFELYAYENLEAELILNDGVEDAVNLAPGEENILTKGYDSLEAGEYEWYVRLETGSDEVLNSSKMYFEVIE